MTGIMQRHDRRYVVLHFRHRCRTVPHELSLSTNPSVYFGLVILFSSLTLLRMVTFGQKISPELTSKLQSLHPIHISYTDWFFLEKITKSRWRINEPKPLTQKYQNRTQNYSSKKVNVHSEWFLSLPFFFFCELRPSKQIRCKQTTFLKNSRYPHPIDL